MDNIATGASPNATKYWFEGALICLSPRLRVPSVCDRAIADAMHYGREVCGCTSFNAVLISIGNLVLLRSFPDGRVERTAVLNLIPVEVHLSMNARERYDDEWIDKEYARHFPKTLDFKLKGSNENMASDEETAHPAIDRSDDVSRKQSNRCAYEEVWVDSQDKASLLRAKDKKDCDPNSRFYKRLEEDAKENARLSLLVRGTFRSLMQFFETTTVEILKPTDRNGRGLPTEVVTMILNNVGDLKTYNACEKVSRSFRNICQQGPLIMDDIALLPRSPRSGVFKDTHPLLQLQKVGERDFSILQTSTGKRTDVEMSIWRNDSFASFRAIIGTEPHRKTFGKGCHFTFECLKLPTSFQTEGNDEWDVPRSETPSPVLDESMWSKALNKHSITLRTSIPYWTVSGER